MNPLRARLGEHALHDSVAAIAMPGREIGYPELVHLVDACAARLVRDGCAPGDTVGFSVPDETGHLIVSLALAALGLRQVILATHAPLGMRIDLARRLAVRRVVVSDPAHAVPGIAVIVLGSAESSDSPSVRPAVPLDGGQDGPRFLFTSSGTTGRAKIYDLDLAAVDWRATTVHRSERGNARQRLYVSHAIEHRAGHVRRLYAAWLGVTSILQAPRTRMSTGALCRAMNPTHLELTVLEAMGLVQDDAIPLPSGTIVHGSGTRIPSALRRRFRAHHGLPLHVHYGASEFGRIASTLDGPGASPTSTTTASAGPCRKSRWRSSARMAVRSRRRRPAKSACAARRWAAGFSTTRKPRPGTFAAAGITLAISADSIATGDCGSPVASTR